ncbi:MAG: tetratricopeptide repeat protein, partial [Promethearchaeota archaeon]
NNGFSELAIELFNEGIELISKEKKDLIASNLNNIGTIHVEQDRYDDGIYFFKHALAVNGNCIPCLVNIVNAYIQKLEFENAKKAQEKLINLLKTLNIPEKQIISNKRLLEFINSLKEDILNINKIDIDEVRIFLLTAERLYLDYKDKEESFDASSIVLYLSKALERMLHDKISIHFNKLIKKYKKKYKNCSKDLKSFFGNLFRERTISLGTWARILNNIENKEVESDVKEFIDILCSKFDKKTFPIIANACNDLSTERNPLSHYKSLTIKEMIDLRKKIIKHLNQVIDLIF